MDHWQIAVVVLRILAAAAGLLLLFAAMFLYPDDRRQVHSRLEEWWLELDHASQHALRGHLRFIRSVARTAGGGFEWLFGNSISRFLLISSSLSATSFVLGMFAFGDFGWAVPTGLLLFAIATACLVQIARRSDRETHDLIEQERLLASPNPPRPRIGRAYANLREIGNAEDPLGLRRRKGLAEKAFESFDQHSVFLYLALLVLFVPASGLVFTGAREKGIGGDVFVTAFLASVACDFVSILITMHLLEKVAVARSALAAGSLLMLDAALAAAMFLIPLTCSLWLAPDEGPGAAFLKIVASANISTALPSLAYVFVALTLLVHRIAWPLVLRPFYNLIEVKILEKRKTLGTVGLFALSLACPGLPQFLQSSIRGVLDLL